MKDGYRVVYENTKVLPKEEGLKNNYPIFLQATDLQTPFIDKSDLFHVHESDWQRYKKGRIKKGEILIEVKGKAEKVAIVPDDFPDKVLVSGSLYKLSVNQRINKYYLLVYLISKYGESFKNRFKTNLLVSFINKRDLFRIPIPKLNDRFQKKIEKILTKTFNLKDKSLKLYQNSERILNAYLDLKDYKTSSKNINIKSFANSFSQSERLDSEYYLPKYEQIVDKITNYPHGRLEDIVDIVKSVEPGTANYGEPGIPFMRVADYDKFGIDEPDVCIKEAYCKENTDKIKKLKLKKGTVLLSKDGSVGIAYTIKKDREMLTSSAILHLEIKDLEELLPEYLALVLNSKLTQMQAERDGGGSIILHWRMGDVKDVLIPILDFEKQKEINDLVEKSFKLKKQSENLLETAKRAVEIAIEKDEESAITFIENKTKEFDLATYSVG